MAKNTKDENQVLSYRHSDRRKNNPEVGVVTPDTDPEEPKTSYRYDPHIDPSLNFDSQRFNIEKIIDDALASNDQNKIKQALEQLKRQQSSYLNWAGKAEKNSFDLDTISLHVHERIDPASILSAVRKLQKKEAKSKQAPSSQLGLFNAPFENLPLRDAVDFYKHDKGWSNRLIAGDSLLVMNSLLQKESMAGQLQMIYFDPPYGIKYGSNFQPFIDKRDVKDGKDEDLTQEPEMIKAFRDTWELGTHSYLTYLRDRIKLAHELLNDTGSIFIQISDENVHHVRELLDEIFGAENFNAQINYRSMSPLGQKGLAKVYDYVIWYVKDHTKAKFRALYQKREIEEEPEFTYMDKSGGAFQKIDKKHFSDLNADDKKRIFKRSVLTSSGYTASCTYSFEAYSKTHKPLSGKSWRTHSDGMERLIKANRLIFLGTNPYFRQYHSDFGLVQLENSWTDTAAGFSDQKVYVVQTSDRIVERCMLMTTDPGDLVFDPTCGSGTTAFTAEKWGRRWMTCDSSRVALTLARQRLITSSFEYYALKYPNEGLKGGFVYQSIPYITLGAIANNTEIDEIYNRLYPAVIDSLNNLNSALSKTSIKFLIEYGGNKDKTLDFSKNDSLQEWEVPPELPDDWNEGDAAKAFNDFKNHRIQLQKAIDTSISAHAESEQLFDKPAIDKTKLRISGPFSVEAVPSPMVKNLDESDIQSEINTSISRSGESFRHHNWKDELLKTGIRGKNNQILKLTDLETLPDVRYLHATGTVTETGERVVVSFGPEYALLEQRQVEMAMREASDLFPRPKMILFCAFDFDPEAAKDIDNTKGIIALKVKMNADLLTDDLKKQRSTNQSFWLMGQPDVQVEKLENDLWQIEVHGFDYFDTAKGELLSGGKRNIAAWLLDTDYDNRSLFPRQVFFPMSGSKDGWNKLKKDIRAELDESALSKFSGTISIPFEAGDFKRVAVKIVDDRGIESLKVIDLV
jgi:adenine-specific DNA-methyltransferase